MKNYIFDRKKDDFIRDSSSNKIFFRTLHDVYFYLHKERCFSDNYINENFFIMRGIKMLVPESIEELEVLSQEQKDRIDSQMTYAFISNAPEIAVLDRVDNMCSQSLDPDLFSKWTQIKKELFKRRKSLQ